MSHKLNSEWDHGKRIEHLEKSFMEMADLLERAALFLKQDEVEIYSLKKRIEQLENKLNSLN